MEQFRRKVDRMINPGIDLALRHIADLNEAMYAHKENDRLVTLHLSSDADTISPLAMAAKTRQALQNLADLLESDESLKGIESIAVISWIVTKYPALIERLGFTIDTNNESDIAHELIKRYSTKRQRVVAPYIKRYELPKVALMNRQDFLRRYGSAS